MQPTWPRYINVMGGRADRRHNGQATYGGNIADTLQMHSAVKPEMVDYTPVSYTVLLRMQ